MWLSQEKNTMNNWTNGILHAESETGASLTGRAARVKAINRRGYEDLRLWPPK